MASAHKRGNSMVKSRINGTWVAEEREIKEGVVHFFHSLLSESKEWRPNCSELSVGVLGGEDAAMLEVLFSEEEDFHERGRFVKSIKASFLVLIPKRGGAEDLRDFRPISLVDSLYKLLTKVLTNGLKKIVGKIVSRSQNAFMEGRQILDASLIANETIDSMQKGDGGGILCKFDIKKATPSGFFQSSWGLKQGDPLSPYFFVIVMGALSCLLNKGGVLSGWQFNGRGGVGVGVEISQLLFAYDTLVFSSSFRWGLENVGEMAHEFGCKLSALPSSYLGLPLGTRFKDVEIWDGVEERLWKRPYISKGGRLTLIQSTLSRRPFGGKLLVGSMRKKRMGGVLVKTSGVETILYAPLFPPYLLFCWLKRLGWKMFGTILEREFRILVSLDSSMTRRNIRLSRNSNDWELDALGELFHMLRDLRISPDEDSVIWKGGGHGLFRIRDAYKLLTGPNVITFPKKSIWVDKVPTKVAFFAWEAT
ncbi:hypothetical protein CK203_087835 [Vitis vinifera]|uniref:Uncharacterized protein n=1 Tax=Vitis vinifera TaxID=29760 RepID=A0A438E4A0_VITVI|nr:hypothetical protein CK203_087835 [Vitis vinifera]